MESKKDGSFYIGKTSDLDERLESHISEGNNHVVTNRKIPWKYFYTLEVENKKAAGKNEKQKVYFESCKISEIAQKLVEKYS